MLESRRGQGWEHLPGPFPGAQWKMLDKVVICWENGWNMLETYVETWKLFFEHGSGLQGLQREQESNG